MDKMLYFTGSVNAKAIFTASNVTVGGVHKYIQILAGFFVRRSEAVVVSVVAMNGRDFNLRLVDGLK